MASDNSVIKVDVLALGDLATALDRVSDALSKDFGVFGGEGCGIEHRGLVRALDNFDNRWSDKRKKMENNTRTLSKNVTTVADSFSGAEAELVKALKSGGSGTDNDSADASGGGGR